MTNSNADRILEILATNIRLARKQVGLSQEQLADAAQIDRTYASGIERSKRNPSIMVLARIADAVGVELAELLDKRTADDAMKAKKNRNR